MRDLIIMIMQLMLVLFGVYGFSYLLLAIIGSVIHFM